MLLEGKERAGTPAQQRTVLSNMPTALALSDRMAYPIPSPQLLRYLSLHYPKIHNKLRSSRWHWPSLGSFSLFIRQAGMHTWHTQAHGFEEKRKMSSPLTRPAFTLKTTQPSLTAEALLQERCFAAHRAHEGLKDSELPSPGRKRSRNGSHCTGFTIVSRLNSLSSLISLFDWLLLAYKYRVTPLSSSIFGL